MLRRLLPVGILIPLLNPAAHALPEHYSVAQLYHTKWTIQDGAPVGIQNMSQTKDGFLWLGTVSGLFRFDGVQFERFTAAGGVSLLSHDIYTLYATPEGGLWIGYRYGGASYLHQGRLSNFGLAQGLPGASVTSFGTSGDGTVWAGTSRGLYRLAQGQWHLAGADWNLPERFVFALIEDREHVLWMISESKVFYLRRGARQFERLPVRFETELDTAAITLRPDGTAALCTRENFGVLKLVAPSDPKSYVPEWDHRRGIPGVLGTCAFDREGHLWVGSEAAAGRFPPEHDMTSGARDNLERYRADLVSLTGRVLTGVLEDREGNIWFATYAGLDRFRAPPFSKMPLKVDSFSIGLAPAGRRGMWVVTSGGHVYRVYRGQIEEQQEIQPSSYFEVSAVASSRSGELWIGRRDEILHWTSKRQWQASVRPAVSTGRDYDNIQAIAPDVRGETWVSVPRVGVYRVVGDRWTLTEGRKENVTETATVLFADAAHRVWAGYTDGAITIHDGERVDTLLDGKHTPLGAVLSFAQQRDGIWIGSERGLWRSDGTSIRAVMGSHGPFSGVAAIVSAETGELWLGTGDGIVHIAAAELAQVFNDPAHRVRYQLLNYLDGSPSNVVSLRPQPTAAADSDGRVWLAGSDGVAWLDPSRTPHNNVVPTVMLKSMVADGVRYALDSDAVLKLPPRLRNLQISYTAPSLTMPERVTFRYRLADEGADWQDAGTRREAYFTDLPPGRHRFQVIAANNDGVWNETGASVTFVISPTFIQTIWFKLLCALAAVAAIGFLFMMRLRSIKSRMRLRMEEREHIARELHDTFLQAIQGLMLHFQSAMEQIPRHEPSRAMMEDALDRADRVIADGRDTVSNLRADSSASTDLCRELEEAGAQLSEESGVAFVLTVEGEVRELEACAGQEVQRVAIEALTNAFHHSRGTGVELKIVYARQSFSLAVSDDGQGFDPDRSHGGHWGLVGMRERASRIGGRLLVSSGPRGTRVTLDVPAGSAYASARNRRLLRSLIG